MKAYHFLEADMTAGSGDEKPWVIGEERELEGEIVICERGYHSSPSWHDALQYAPGGMACIVEVSKPIQKHKDKQVSRKRKLIDARDADKALRIFACDCAGRALKKAKVTDKRSRDAVKVARLYSEGKATKEELGAARDAAGDAAWAAAWAAAWDAAGDAAGDAEIKWQRRHLNKLMKELFEPEP